MVDYEQERETYKNIRERYKAVTKIRRTIVCGALELSGKEEIGFGELKKLSSSLAGRVGLNVSESDFLGTIWGMCRSGILEHTNNGQLRLLSQPVVGN